MRALSAALVFVASIAWAQTQNSTYPTPRIASVFPCGGQVDKTFEVTVRGSDLDEPTALRFSHKGLTAELVSAPEVKKDATKGMAKGPTNTTTKFKITIAKDVPPGVHEVRFVGRWGVSNPRAFVVGTQSEIVETEPNSDVPQAQKVELGTVVNGVIEAQTDVDYFSFAGKAGQRVLLHCAASSIDSRARPFIEVYASDGRSRIGINRNYSGNDALCDVTLPSDGDYFIRISEFAYTAGGGDYFYRLTVGTGSWVDAIYPPMIDADKATNVTMIGRKLPGATKIDSVYENFPVQVAAPKNGLDFQGYAMLPQAMGLADGFMTGKVEWNQRPLLFAQAPVVLEAMGDNDTPEKAQAVKAPCDIAGVIFARYDRDCYRFSAKKDEPLMIELFAERLGTTLDGVLSIRGPDGKEIAGEATLDDDPEALHPTSFFNRTTDPPPFKLVPPRDGEYTVTVSARDANVNYGPRSIYRLRIVPPKPDYRAVVMARNRDLPSGVTVIPGGETALDVFVQRLDGFNGPVTVTASGLPAGVTAKPSVVGTGQKWGLIVLSGAADLKSAEADVSVTCTATIDGKEAKRTARSASITWNVPNANNSPTIARMDRGLVIAARPLEKAPYRLAVLLDKAVVKGADGKERPAGAKLAVKPGEKIVVPVSVAWQGGEARANAINLTTEPTFSTQGQSALAANNGQPIVVAKDKTELPVTIDVRATIAPGVYSVMIRGDTKTQMISDSTGKAKKEYTVLAFAEPFTVKVLPISLGKLTAQASTIKAGQGGTLTVKVERAFDFSGEFPIAVKFPAGSGLSAEAATIKAGSNEVKIAVTASKDAKPGNVQNVSIESLAVFDGDEVNHKIQATITIAK